MIGHCRQWKPLPGSKSCSPGSDPHKFPGRDERITHMSEPSNMGNEKTVLKEKKKSFWRPRWLRHLGGRPALFLTKLPGGVVSVQPRPSQALSGACWACHMQDPNQTYSWQRPSSRRQGCQGCPDTERKSAPALGVPSQEDSTGKSVKLLVEAVWRQKHGLCGRGRGKGDLGSCFDFFLFVSSQRNGTSLLNSFSTRLGTSVTFHNCQLNNKITYVSELSGNWLEEAEIGGVTDKEIHKWGSICHFPERCCFPKPGQLVERKRTPRFLKLPWQVISPAFLSPPNHLTVVKFLVIQEIKMNWEENGSPILPPGTHRVTGPEALGLQAPGHFHTDGNTRVPNHPGGPMASELRSHTNLCAGGEGRHGAFTLYSIYTCFFPLTPH